jgi:hypothetical protein
MSPIGFRPIRFGNDSVIEALLKQLQQQQAATGNPPQAKPTTPSKVKAGDIIEWSHTHDSAGIQAVRHLLQKDES